MILKIAALGIDPALELVFGAVKEDHHILQMLALVGDAQRVDHRLLLLIALAQPQAVLRYRQLRSFAFDIARLQAGELRRTCVPKPA